MPDALESGFTVADLARRYRVSPDKIRAWIRVGELCAINTSTALCGKPRFVVTADALVAFEQRRHAGSPPKAKRRRKAQQIDFYPD